MASRCFLPTPFTRNVRDITNIDGACSHRFSLTGPTRSLLSCLCTFSVAKNLQIQRKSYLKTLSDILILIYWKALTLSFNVSISITMISKSSFESAASKASPMGQVFMDAGEHQKVELVRVWIQISSAPHDHQANEGSEGYIMRNPNKIFFIFILQFFSTDLIMQENFLAWAKKIICLSLNDPDDWFLQLHFNCICCLFFSHIYFFFFLVFFWILY